MKTTVLLVDDHDLIRQGLRRALEQAGDFEVVGEASRLSEGSELLESLTPAVLIIDVRLPDGSGIDLARAARKARPDLGIVVLTMYAGDEQLFEALDAGASAFVPKSSPAEDVVAAARHAASSPRAFTANDLAEAMKRRLSPTGPQISPREKEVLQLLADGLGVAQISRQLFISESTTKTHISKLYEKLGAGNRAQAIMSALRMGLIRQDTTSV
jgi:DNA-binding NarL/FixJ family response regulator